ncbi:MAG: hypothetical protein J2O48_10390, partial [Solirubrobacterales bacterium]|nr:hypothetical protein [Solirubrobacterales bacterium]
RLPGGRIDARGMRAVADAARHHGNGIIELTSRASLQIRGIRGDIAPILQQAGLLPSLTHERVRNILASPYAGPEVDATVAELDELLCADPELANLSGRHLFAVDDGTGLHAHAADITVGPGEAEQAIKAARQRRRIPGLVPTAQPRVGKRTLLAPLARLTPEQMGALAELDEIRIAANRTITVRQTPPDIGLIDDPGSGWVGLTACAGLGACNKAEFDVRAHAAARAAERGPGAPREHHAACERNCGALHT